VNRKQAKEILSLYRPGTADAQDPSFDEARRVAAEDPELARWFESQCASYQAMREKFQEIPVPPGLKEQILSERQPRMPAERTILHVAFRRHGPLLAAAAAIVLLFILLGWRFAGSGRSQLADYQSYRNRMISTASKAYAMALATNDLAVVHSYLQRRQAPADYVVPDGLQKARAVGCAIVPWNGNPVSMICFNSGRPLGPGAKSDLWLFVADAAAGIHAPASAIPALEQSGWVVTASWSKDGKTYLLAAPGDEAFLRRYL
jgi:hypothetical protein